MPSYTFFNDTAEFLTYSNISAKSKPYAQKHKHLNNGSRWVRIAKNTRVTTVILFQCPVHLTCVTYCNIRGTIVFFLLSRNLYLFLGPMMKLVGRGFRFGSVSTSTPSLSSSLHHHVASSYHLFMN